MKPNIYLPVSNISYINCLFRVHKSQAQITPGKNVHYMLILIPIKEKKKHVSPEKATWSLNG